MSDDTEIQPDASDESAGAEKQETKVTRARKPKPAASDDLFPIKLVKSYRPFGLDPDGWGDFKVERDGELVEPGINDDGYADRDKVTPGTIIHVPREEARRALKEGIAERADEI